MHFCDDQYFLRHVDLQKGNPYDAAGTFTYACTGNSREILRICPSWELPATARVG